jgi:hypothetical protein
MYSILDELEEYRRPGDGRFELKMCWPDSGFEKCQHWIQLKNPMHNPSSTNTHVTCVDCPYSSDSDPDGNPVFRGLQYNGATHLLDGDSDGSYFQVGSDSTHWSNYPLLFYGPQLKNDVGVDEHVTKVELYVRPDPNGATCVDCKACYDADGAVRMATYSSSSSPTTFYSAPACPAYCLTREHVPEEPRAVTLQASHQLVAATQGLAEMPCVTVISHDATEDEATNTTICEGLEMKSTDAVPASVGFGRNGGVITKAYFVAPMAATYTFNTRFDDGGELWLSPNGDPRAAERLIAIDSAEDDAASASTAPGADAAASPFCADWSCAGDRCFRSFAARVSYDLAEKKCKDHGAVLGAFRSPTEKTAFMAALTEGGSYWIGLSDRSKEGYFSFTDGTEAGYAHQHTFADAWSSYGYSWNSGEPNDYNNIENCVEIFANGYCNDLPCSYSEPFVCEIPSSQCSSKKEPRSSTGIAMEAGEVRYLEMLGYNNDGASVSLLTLTIDPDDPSREAWTTSETLGLSGEFFREIRTNAPAIEVKVNGITSSCGPEGGDCSFTYSDDHSPRVTAIEPATSVPGVTAITISGTGFSHHEQLNNVDIGGAPCAISAANKTYIICTVPAEQGTAGVFIPTVTVFNKGFAVNEVSHTILMTISSVSPNEGSLYGGMTLTLTGSGFARFGLHNQIKLVLQNDTKLPGNALPKGTHDIYDDDWLWQRGHVSNNGTDSRYSEVLCVPRTAKNRPCRYTSEDSGFECTEWLAYAGLDIREREAAEWFDFNTPTSIECVVESFGVPLPAGSLALVSVRVVNTTVLLDSEGLVDGLAAAKLNFDCSELSHCETRDR